MQLLFSQSAHKLLLTYSFHGIQSVYMCQLFHSIRKSLSNLYSLSFRVIHLICQFHIDETISWRCHQVYGFVLNTVNYHEKLFYF